MTLHEAVELVNDALNNFGDNYVPDQHIHQAVNMVIALKALKLLTLDDDGPVRLAPRSKREG